MSGMKSLAPLARRVIARAKTLAPKRGGDHGHDHAHIPYENPLLTHAKGGHPGNAGKDWGTGYMYVGGSAPQKFRVAAGLLSVLGGGIGVCLWSASRQL